MSTDELFDQAESLQNLLVSQATNGNEDNAEYMRLRQTMLSQPSLESVLPRVVRTCRNLSQFWQFIKFEFSTYALRRDYLWREFKPMLDLLEGADRAPSDQLISGAMEKFDSSHVQATWFKALERRNTDPEGAITIARTLLESICKHILDDSAVQYGEGPDLNKLYRLTAEQLEIAPSQHTEQVFRQILGGCTAVVEGLGSLRNKLSDSHGRGKVGIKPAPRHAELAVNLAGALATFLLTTWEARSEKTS